MKQIPIILIIMCVTIPIVTSCKKAEQVKVEKTSTSQGDKTLEQAMKRASRDLRRLSNSIEGRD